MVVLTEEFHGLTLKRKGADEPGLFDAAGGDDNDRSGFPLSCRANKMRRLTGPDPHGEGAPAWGATAAGQDDVMPMCDDGLAAAGDGGDDEEGALVLYGGGGRSDEAPRVAMRDCARWVRAMLREADSRTVRELLAGAALEHGSEGLALALVPWVPPSAAVVVEEAEPSTAAEEAGSEEEGVAAMDVEEDVAPVRQWSGQGAYGSGGAEGLVYRWPQHCMTPLLMPPAPQPSPVMWSW